MKLSPGLQSQFSSLLQGTKAQLTVTFLAFFPLPEESSREESKLFSVSHPGLQAELVLPREGSW